MDKNNDIITTGFSKTTKIEVDHIEIKEPEVTAIADALPQKTIFEHFYLKGELSDISEKKFPNHDNSVTVFHTTVFHEKTGQCEMTLFRSIVGSLKGETFYFSNHVHLDKFKTKKVIKTSDVMKLKELKEKLRINIDGVISPHQGKKCQFFEMNINTIENKILWKKCKNEVTPDENDIVMCQKCFIMTFTNQSKINNEVSCIVQDECKT